MLAKIDFVSASEPATIGLQPYYHPLYGYITLTEIDMGSNRSKAKLSSEQETWVNHSDLHKLVASVYPNDPIDFKTKDIFYYYQMSLKYPTFDSVNNVEPLGIIGKNSKMLIKWQNIFKILGDFDRSDYRRIINYELLHTVVEVGQYPLTGEYFIVPEKKPQIYINSISFDLSFLKKELYKQGFELNSL